MGYGGKDAGKDYGGVGIIDPETDKHVGDVRAEAHPAERLPDNSGKTLFVFVSTASKVQVVDTKKREVVSTWSAQASSMERACTSACQRREWNLRKYGTMQCRNSV